MSIRRLIIEVDPATLNVAEFCREHGVSTWFFYDLRRRHTRDGPSVFEPQSRAPRRVANKTPLEVEDAIVEARKRLIDAGHDAGPASIYDDLTTQDLVPPSESTIWRILSARGFIEPQPSKAPKTARARFHTATRANDCWQLDDTTWHLADGTEAKIFNVIDDHSRLLVASVAMASCTGAAAVDALADAAATLGWPRRFLSDNAQAFRYTVARAVAELGVIASHTKAAHPQTNGKVERFHGTLKHWLAHQPPPRDLAELQTHLDMYRQHYNHHRKHRSLNRQRPGDVWATAPKSGPSDRPLDTTTRIYRSKVNGGTIHAGTKLTITISSAHNGHTALAVITGTTCHVFVNGTLARQLTIDPTRKHQPLHPRPGRPPTVREDPRHL